MYKFLPALMAANLTGCVVYADDVHYDEPIDVHHEDVYNYAPEVIDAAAGVFWDDYYYDDVWYFDAVVDDFNGPYDVVAVYADVYDEWGGGYLIESFELYPTDDPYLWTSEWMGHETFLDPFYRGYTVDLVAYDSYDEASVMTVWAAVY